MVSAGHVGGTRCLGIVSSAADVLGMRLVRGVSWWSVRNVYVFGSGRPREDGRIKFVHYQPCGNRGCVTAQPLVTVSFVVKRFIIIFALIFKTIWFHVINNRINIS